MTKDKNMACNVKVIWRYPLPILTVSGWQSNTARAITVAKNRTPKTINANSSSPFEAPGYIF